MKYNATRNQFQIMPLQYVFTKCSRGVLRCSISADQVTVLINPWALVSTGFTTEYKFPLPLVCGYGIFKFLEGNIFSSCLEFDMGIFDCQRSVVVINVITWRNYSRDAFRTQYMIQFNKPCELHTQLSCTIGRWQRKWSSAFETFG